MSFHRSIRWRLLLWYGALLAVLLAGFGITAYAFERSSQFRRIDEALRQRLPLLVESQHPVRGGQDLQLREFTPSPRMRGMFDGGGDADFYYAVWLRRSERPQTLSASAPTDVPMPQVGDPPTRQRGSVREVFLFPGPGDCVLVGRRIDGDLAALRRLAWGLAGAGLLILLAGLAGGGWLVVTALRPIREISETAHSIAQGDLKRRIATADTDSELGRLAAVLNDTFARLDAAFTQQARFTSDAAHELRTPVTVVLTHVQNALDAECANPEHREALEAIDRAARRMKRLIDALLELVRFDAGQETIARNPFAVAPLMSEALALVAPLAVENQVRIAPAIADVTCLGDPARLEQVVVNLLTNAIVHNRPGGRVRVEVLREAAEVVLVVADDGPGIAAEDLPHVFERFYRGDRSRSSRGGTGLGLAISRTMVEAMGGRIAVTSEPGQGARFDVRLPAA